MTDEERYRWVAGEGGPLIVIQASVVPHWRGAEDFDNSLMQGGTVETDYDVICRYDEGVVVALHRYGRDMLVLTDSELAAHFVPSHSDEVVILRWLGRDRSVEELAGAIREQPLSRAFQIIIEDNFLRLLVGADDGSGDCYGFAETPITPGVKVCSVYEADEAVVVVLRSLSV